jgi:hypothetical protein
MKTIHHRKFWWAASIAAAMCFVSAAAAAATSAEPFAVAGQKSLPLRSALAAERRHASLGVRVDQLLRRASSRRAVENANPASFSDPTGDSGSAADISGVVVSNTGNRITFRINVVKLLVPSDGQLVIAIDSDHNTSTGDSGIDYAFFGDLSTNSFAVVRWNGSDFVISNDPTATANTDATGLTFSINSSDLGNTSEFSFWARIVQGNAVSAGNHDDAPDVGAWDYQLGPTAALKLTVGIVTASKARAGKPFVAAIEVVRSDGADTNLSPNDVTCAATAGTVRMKARTTVGDGPAAGCAWLLPRRSRGKTLRAAVTAAVDGATVTKRFTTRIR